MKSSSIIKFVKDESGYWIGFISGICGIIDYFVDAPKWLKMTWFSIIALFFLICICKLFFYIKQTFISQKEWECYYKNQVKEYKKDFNESLKVLFREVHDFHHYMRNELCKPTSKKIEEVYFVNICRNLCNEIKQIYNSLWGKNNSVSVCIKQIITNQSIDKDWRNWEVETIARSAGTDSNRSKNDENKRLLIADNSDFFIILSPDKKYGDISLFASQNLTTIEQDFLNYYDMKYLNSTKNFIDFYKSTIVVPIRTSKRYLNSKLQKYIVGDDAYHLVGFLCIDTKEILSDDKKFEAGIELAKALADSMYKLFENKIIHSLTVDANNRNEEQL